VIDVGPHLFWITSRAAGTGAIVLANLSVLVGLLIGAKAMSGRGRGTDLRAVHEVLSLGTLLAIALHGLALLGDGYLHPGLADIAVPFAGRYRPLWTGIGITGGWALAVLGLSYYARDRVGHQRWRILHRFTAVAWILGLAHSFGSGTDAGRSWFLAMLVITAAPALVLLAGSVTARSAPRANRPGAKPRQGSDARAATSKPPPRPHRTAPAPGSAGRLLHLEGAQGRGERPDH